MSDDLRDKVEHSLAKRLDDWLASASETYAGPVGSPNWRKGLVGYLLNGPGAVLPLLREAQAEAWRVGHRRGLLDADLQHEADNPYEVQP